MPKGREFRSPSSVREHAAAPRTTANRNSHEGTCRRLLDGKRQFRRPDIQCFPSLVFNEGQDRITAPAPTNLWLPGERGTIRTPH